MMTNWQFAVLVVLLLWIIWKLPSPRAVDAEVNKMFKQLDDIEARLKLMIPVDCNPATAVSR